MPLSTEIFFLQLFNLPWIEKKWYRNKKKKLKKNRWIKAKKIKKINKNRQQTGHK